MSNPNKGMLPWTTGRTIDRGIHDANGVLLGAMHTPELAAIVVDAVNAMSRVRAVVPPDNPVFREVRAALGGEP
jgi:hypothetical protein